MNGFAKALCAILILLPMALMAGGPPVEIHIEPSRGVDASVDYAALAAHGPWDDRNYQLRASDVAMLPASDALILDPIPAFYRISLRQARPAYQGEIRNYPRSAFNHFRREYGGYEIDGVRYQNLSRGEDGHYVITGPDDAKPKATGFQFKFLNGEARVSTPNGAAETAVAINPVNPDLLIAGSNGPGSGQKMYRSTNGGVTWSAPISLPDGTTCCDPTVGWSTNGTIAYTATLDACTLSGCSVKFYRSTDDGQSWTRTATLTTPSNGSDKEFLHVDSAAASPHKDKVYLAWHDNNVQRFARSTDLGLTFSSPITIDSGGTGIGSDITSDPAGNVYYFYPRFSPSSIRVAKSTDGGATFAAASTIATTQADFDFPLPSMETRNAFVYVAADVDLSAGPFAGSLYVAWTDNNNADSNTAANNHGRVRVAYSRDAGASWTVVDPVGTADVLTVDRYNHWLSVDRNGNVYLIYYSTKLAASRSAGVDLFAVASSDGGVTWTDERRLTTVTSPNIGDSFEWGDYNGMDALFSEVIAIFTDNRDEDGGPAGDSIDAYVVTQPQPISTFSLSATPSPQAICAGAALAPITVTATSQLDFAGQVTLSLPGLNGAVFTGASFGTNPVTVPAGGNATSMLSLSTLVGAAAGTYELTIQGDSTTPLRSNSTAVDVTVSQALAAAPTLVSPADGATSISVQPTLSWNAVSGAVDYLVEVATDPAFNTIVYSQAVVGTSHVVGSGLATATTHYWRVTARNGCGEQVSLARSFTTTLEICFNGNTAIPDNNATGISNDLTGSAGTLADLDVAIEIDHPYVGDVVVTLEHVSVIPALIDRPGRTSTGFGCDKPNINVVADDEGGDGSIEAACATSGTAVSGRRTPNQALSAFDGQDFSGVWRLKVADAASGDVGSLKRWCLIPTFAVPNADLVVAMTGSALVAPGGAASFEITVTNLGPDAASGFVLSDTFPADFVPGSANCQVVGSGSCGSQSLVGQALGYTGMALTAGGGNSLVITVNGTLAPAAAGSVNNTASVSGGGSTDPVSGNNSASHSISVSGDGLFNNGFEG